MAQVIRVTILNREQVVFDGEVTSLTSVNDTGEFDILPSHQNFIALIKQKVVLRPPEKPAVQLPIERGILHVLNNRVQVFLGIGK